MARRAFSHFLFWLCAVAGAAGAIFLQWFWALDLPRQDEIAARVLLADPEDFNLIALSYVFPALLGVALFAYLLSLDSRRARVPGVWTSLGAAGLGIGLLGGSSAYWFAMTPLGEAGTAWIASAVGAVLMAGAFFLVEFFFRWFWSSTVRSLDQRNLGGAALATSRLALLWHPGQDRLLRSVALERFRRGARGEVSTQLREAYARGDRDPALLELLCQLANEEKQPAEFLHYLRDLLQQFPDDTHLQATYIEELLDQGHREEALEAMERYGVADNDMDALERFGTLLAEAGRFDRAVPVAARIGELEGIPMKRSDKLLREIVTRQDRADAYNILAAHAERCARRDQQARWLEKSLLVEPEQDGVREKFLALCEELDLHDKAEAMLQEELERQPRNHSLALRYAETLLTNGKPGEARAFLEEYEIPVDAPYGFRRLSLLARAAYSDRRLVQAQEAAEAALRLKDDEELRRLLRQIERDLLTTEVAQLVERAHAEPHNLELNLDVLRRMIAGGHGERAVAHADVVLRHNSTARPMVVRAIEEAVQQTGRNTSYALLNYLADLQVAANRFDDALATVHLMSERSMEPLAAIREGSQKILRRSPHHLPTLKMLGDTYRDAAKFTEMIHSYSLYLANGGEETEELDRVLANAYLELEDYPNAKRFVTSLLQVEGRAEENAELLRRFIPLAVEYNDAQTAAELQSVLEQLAPGDRATRRLRGQVNDALSGQRIAYLRREVDSGKASAQQLEELGDLCAKAEDWDQAIQRYQQATRMPGATRIPRAKLAYCYAQKRLFDMAGDTLGELTLSLQDDPAELEELMNWTYQTADVLEEHHYFIRAQALFKQLVKIDAGYKDVLKRVERLTAR